MWIKICGITTCGGGERGARRPGRCHRLRVRAEPAAGDAGAGRAAGGARAAGHSALAVTRHPRRARSTRSAGCSSPTASDRRRGPARAAHAGAPRAAAGAALRPQTPSPLAARGCCSRARRAAAASWRLGRGGGLARQTELILAGGLDAENVAEAIAGGSAFRRRREQRRRGRPGVKDPGEDREFVRGRARRRGATWRATP